jgi:hypothetical protein
LVLLKLVNAFVVVSYIVLPYIRFHLTFLQTHTIFVLRLRLFKTIVIHTALTAHPLHVSYKAKTCVQPL